MKENDVVQFNENHEWCGCLGIIKSKKYCGDNGSRYTVSVSIPMQGTAYIYVMDSDNAIERIGEAVLVLEEGE